MEVAEASYSIKNDEENISLSMAMGLALLAVVALVGLFCGFLSQRNLRRFLGRYCRVPCGEYYSGHR